MTFDDLTFNPPRRRGMDNEQAMHTFDNGYGVSVIRGPYTYGGEQGFYELAVIGPDGHLDYSTPVTSDVEGWLTPNDVTRLLQAIEELPPKTMEAQ